MRVESLQDLLCQFPDFDGIWNSEDLPGTESQIRQGLMAEDEHRLASHSLELLTQLARVQALQGNLAEARVTLEKARKLIFEKDPAQRSRAEIRLLLEQGRLLCLNMTPVKAQSLFSQAWTLAQKENEPFFSIDAAFMLSVCQPPKYKNEWLQKALQLAHSATDEKSKLWRSYLEVMNGWYLFDIRHFDQALESFRSALAKTPTAEARRVILIKWAIARALRAMNRVEEALEMQRALLTELNNLNESNGHVFLEIAECLQLLQKAEDAKAYFEMAYNSLSVEGWYADNKAFELSRMQNIFKKR